MEDSNLCLLLVSYVTTDSQRLRIITAMSEVNLGSLVMCQVVSGYLSASVGVTRLR